MDDDRVAGAEWHHAAVIEVLECLGRYGLVVPSSADLRRLAWAVVDDAVVRWDAGRHESVMDAVEWVAERRVRRRWLARERRRRREERLGVEFLRVEGLLKRALGALGDALVVAHRVDWDDEHVELLMGSVEDLRGVVDVCERLAV